MSKEPNRLKNYIEFQIEQNSESLNKLIEGGEEKSSKLCFHYQEKIAGLKYELGSISE